MRIIKIVSRMHILHFYFTSNDTCLIRRQADIKQMIESHDREAKNNEKKVQVKIGSKCEAAGCDIHWLFDNTTNCIQCATNIQCLGCGRFLCARCREEAMLQHGLAASCNLHAKHCDDCAPADAGVAPQNLR